jgi:hypothetical protein
MALPRPFVIVVGVVALGGMLAACSGDQSATLPKPSDAFCTAARRYDDQLGKLTATGTARFEKQIEWVTPMAEHAPKDIKHDAEVFLDALQQRAAGNTKVATDPGVKTAIENVNRRAAQGCQFYEGDPSSGGM